MSSKSLFEQFDSFFSELIPLPKEIRNELVNELGPEIEKMRRQVEAKRAAPEVAVKIPQPTPVKKPVRSEMNYKKPQAKRKVSNRGASLHQRLNSPEHLRESMILAEILGPPVALRKK